MTPFQNLYLNNCTVVVKEIKILSLLPLSLILLLFIVFNPSVYGDLTAEFVNKQRRFINELYKNKRYFDCIAETTRLLGYIRSDSDQKELNYLIESCYFAGKQYKTVISHLQNIKIPPEDKYSLSNLYLLSHSYLNIGFYDPAKSILYGFNYINLDGKARDGLFINRIELLIRNYEYANILNEIENAEKYLTEFNSFFLIDFKKDIECYREIGLKSKWLSVSLSAILPGAGQIYSGRIADGLLTLGAVAGSACGAWYFFNKKDKPMAFALTFFSCLFYTGNLYGAYNSAEDANKRMNETFSGNINKKYNLYYDPADYLDIGIIK